MAYVPNKPLSMRKGLHEFESAKQSLSTTSEVREWIFEHGFVNMTDVKEVITTARTLVLPSKHTIGKLDAQFAELGSAAYTAFKEELDQIGATINERNRENARKGLPIYHYLHPSVVPASIDI